MEDIGDEGGESCDKGGEDDVGEDGVGLITSRRGGVGTRGTTGGVSGNVRKEMSSIVKVEEDGRG